LKGSKLVAQQGWLHSMARMVNQDGRNFHARIVNSDAYINRATRTVGVELVICRFSSRFHVSM
jgi:hypothetical protein